MSNQHYGLASHCRRLTLKELTPDQRRRLAAAIKAACELHGVELACDLPRAVRDQVSRDTLDTFTAENTAKIREEERGRTTTPAPAPVKTFNWSASRRR